MKDIKDKILQSLQAFSVGNLTKNALKLFNALGYNADRQAPLDAQDYACFKATYVDTNPRFNEDKALVNDWKYVDLLFQLSKEEVNQQHSLFDTKRVDDTIIESYLFFAIELAGVQYTRTDLSSITREINKLFPMPAMVLFKYGETLTLAVISRRLHKLDESKDVLLKKVTLIKDINIASPHRAHVEILFDLSFDELLRKHKFANFVELHKAWEKTLDIKELNKRFYQELANWYFWAMDYVSFPDPSSVIPGEDPESSKKSREIRNATNLIRLITRVIFIWFIKEKGLVPDALFDYKELGRLLKAFAQDKTSCNYYKAILQNLFFGTLNQKMDERGFAREGSFAENRSNYGVKNLFRYFDLFAVNEAEALNLFKDVPFLNGGLFDCLDKENEAGKVIYADGFSRNPKKQAIVPDFLFFGDEEEYDLNAVYGTKNKRYKVHGLIDLLSHYKFTVTENTPIEEEVALDPELLGKVFENLLASYNPETQTTARKQTGSFYTPREIVNYMVDESLKAYLKGVLVEESSMMEDDAKAGLDLLFEYTEEEHVFDEAETQMLINAIDKCKILDPACGSGAFPMGVLHKTVHILHKLDPNNKQWEQRQIDKVDKLIEEAQGITDTAAREQVIAGLEQSRQDIEDAFGSNELDYGRKLYLIENCIYGVDIQPIAVQIAKLRFFISLVIDQKKQAGKENLGIRALPNLETKFVAANTLIGLEKLGQGFLKNLKIIQLENDLKSLRHQYFSAKTRRDKLNWQKKDRVLREEISKLLIDDGLDKTTAQLIVSFDPYDQNASSPFFDPEWMFGITDGFDVVIGNPPYINISNLKPDEYRLLLREKYRSAKNKTDTYGFFLEQGFNLLNKLSYLSYIIPQTWKATDSFSKLREIIFKERSLAKIVDLSFGTFDAIVKPMVVLISNEYGKHKKIGVYNENFVKVSEIDINEVLTDPTLSLNTNLCLEQKKVNRQIESGSIRLETIIQFSRGIKTSNDNRFIHVIQKNGDYKKVFRGKNIKSYQLNWGGEYIWYRPDLMKEKIGSVSYTKDFFEVPVKLVIQRVNSSMQLLCAYDNKQNYFIDTTNVSRYESWDKKTSLKYLCSLLNSKLINYWYCNKYLMPTIGIYELHSIPIRLSSQQDKYSLVTDYIIQLKETGKDSLFFESLIDPMVYELYFPDEIKAAGCGILKHLTDLPELKDDWSDEQKLAAIEKIHRELSAPSHPVSIAMKKMQDIPEVRIIEGLNK